MEKLDLSRWQHEHDFTVAQEHGERRSLQVLALTAITMVVEIVCGSIFGSMALLADGWHMGTHVAAFAITIFAYRYARKHARSDRFSFGTGKVSVLGGFASAIALVVVAFMMAMESVHRLFSPQSIRFNEAIFVAIVGLAVNLISALLLQSHHHHGHGHSHDHHHDHNLRAAYFHVLADALTSLLAIVALTAGKFWGWHWLDATMGIVGALVITKWAHGLIQETSGILLDESLAQEPRQAIVDAIQVEKDSHISDMHVWKVGPNHFAAIVAIVAQAPKPPDHYKALLGAFAQLAHVTVEVNSTPAGQPLPARQFSTPS